ncbi:unnamed protein product [Prorocentrum cordatum]|uniref:Uncharacterized protein n=1 Tax=Prorocentrum cordatum TaxID=2364126 RepID=A0ABN9T5N2_9DINO|nr:unnamed protein product [Polarella glacialis]
MQATIKHLQNAVDAKSTTIGILSKASREGGDLETHITNAVQTKYAAIIKAKDDEIMMLANKAAKASEARPSVAMQEVREALQKSLNEYRDRCKVLEKDKKELTKTLAEQKEQLANVGKDAQNLEAMRGMVATLEEERDCLKRTQQELLESLQQERAELERAQSGAGGGGGADQEAIARLEGDLAEAWKKVEETKLRADAAELRASQAASASAGAAVAERRVEEEKKKASEMASQMRDYQMKAFELKSENDALAQQLEALQEEMTQELEEKSRELEETQKELSVLQADRDGHLRIAKEQIDSRLQEVRQNTQAELQSQLAEQAKERQEEQRQLKELSDEVDKLRLTRDAQLAELKALRQAVGDTDSRDQARGAPRALRSPPPPSTGYIVQRSCSIPCRAAASCVVAR